MAVRRQSAGLAEHTREAVVTRELSRVLVWLPPLASWPLILIVAVVLHKVWPGRNGALAVALVAAGMTWWDWHLTRHRKSWARYPAPVTAALAGLWLAWVTWTGFGRVHGHPGAQQAIAGAFHSPQFRVYLVFGLGIAGMWAHWLHIHDGDDETGGGQVTKRKFAQAAAKAGYPGLKLVKVVVDGTRKTAKLGHIPGMVHEDVPKALGQVESAGHWAPGTLVPSRDMDDAGYSGLVIADPRGLREPIPWPGPSAAGQSWAKPRRLGSWQDGTPILVTGPAHMQIMAMSNAGKTEGCFYSWAGERISRNDVNTVVIDLMKGDQFVGPLRGSVNYVASTPEQARWVLRQVLASGKARANHLATRHLGTWAEGCGLNHCAVWIEEAADLFQALDDGSLEDDLFPLLRAARSWGWEVDYSLHRASYDQMPTFLRDMVAMCTMGVRNASHAKFGLSDLQWEADCSPQDWADRPEYQGMTYLDHPGIPPGYRTMKGRYFYWKGGPAAMAAYAAQFPAKPWDAVTAPFFANPPGVAPAPEPAPEREAVTLTDPQSPQAGQEEDDPMRFFGLRDEDPWQPGDDDLPELDEEEAELPIGSPAPAAGPDTPVSPDVALEELRAQIHQWRVNGVPQPGGRPAARVFAIRDLREALESKIGRTRGWAYQVLPKLETEGEIRSLGPNKGWEILPKLDKAV